MHKAFCEGSGIRSPSAPKLHALLLAIALLMLLAQPARATIRSFIGPSGGDWDTAGNWSPSGVPLPGDAVSFSSGSGTYSYDDNYTAGNGIYSLVLGTLSASYDPTLVQNAGQLVTISATVNNGEYLQSGGTLLSGTMTLGQGTWSTSASTFNLGSGSYVLDNGSLTGSYLTMAQGGTGNFILNGGIATFTNQIMVGGVVWDPTFQHSSQGQGSITLNNGTLIASSIVVEADEGTFTQTGGYSSFGTVNFNYNVFLNGGSLAATTAVTSGFTQNGSLAISNFGTLNLQFGNSLEAGTLNSVNTTIGELGVFTQSGGYSSLGNLQIAIPTTPPLYESAAVELTGGTLVATSVTVAPFFSSGTIIQSAGVSNLGTLSIGVASDSFGDVSLSGGSLSASYTLIAAGNGYDESNAGTFDQNGGSSSLGTLIDNNYLIFDGGSLTASDTGVGVAGAASGLSDFFLQSAGSCSLGTLSIATLGNGARGYVVLIGGTFTAGATSLGSLRGSIGTISQSGTQTFSHFGPVQVGPYGTIALAGGTMQVQSITSDGSISITGGTLAITGAGFIGTGSIASAGFSISGNGVLDVGSSGLVIEYGSGASPVGDLPYISNSGPRNYPANSIQAYAQTGINGLNWNGPGIMSSVAENDSNGLTAVGVADENDLDNVYPSDYTVAGGGTGTWMGQPINDTNNVLVRMTYYGDGNLDGVVNRLDVTALSLGFSGLAGYVGWSDGDYTYAGDISKIDVSLLAQSYLFQGAPLGDAITSGQAQYMLALDPDMPAAALADFQSIAGVPEPATFLLTAMPLLLALSRRQSRGSRTLPHEK
jgi:hypothetical protein